MIKRRNDRRRRLMSEEYVSTFVEPDDSNANEDAAAEKTESAKRTYAFGADRRSQLKTTDLFPKTLWVITLCGLILFGIVAGLNALNIWAPAWRPYIGNASAHAISLNGPGTLTSWMLSMMLLLTGLASLQIFALRKHRCDDYGGTYRVWLIVPPIFFIASIAAIVDFQAIIYHLASLAQLTSLTHESLIPMTIKLSVLALVMVRMLFEIRNSKGAFSMLVVAWLAVAISTVLNTQWAENRIGSQELGLAYPNSVLVAVISLLLSHLLYVRFVYLHAHGEIALKKRVPVASKSKRSRAQKQSKAKQPAAKKDTAAAATLEKKEAKETAAKTNKRSAKKLQTAKPATPVPQPVVEAPAKVAATKTAPAKAAPAKVAATKPDEPQPAPKPAQKKVGTMADFQALLKQKQAKKAAASQDSPAAAPLSADRENTADGEVIQMSKSERRRARKAEKAKRRAA